MKKNLNFGIFFSVLSLYNLVFHHVAFILNLCTTLGFIYTLEVILNFYFEKGYLSPRYEEAKLIPIGKKECMHSENSSELFKKKKTISFLRILKDHFENLSPTFL